MKVGDYVRTKQGIIGKYTIVKKGETIPNWNGGYSYKEVEREYINNYIYNRFDDEIIKSSPNIIDLIEAGDYVNGIYIEKNNGKYLETLEDDYDNSRLGHIEFIKIYPNEIKSIITKEQFESMEYKVEGSDKE